MSLFRSARVASRVLRNTTRTPSFVRSFNSSRSLREEAAEEPKPEFQIQSANVQEIYDKVLTLNIMETIELVDALKDKFGYVEMAVSAAPAAGAPAAAAVEEEAAPEKTEFNVRLDKFAAGDKIKIIKEVRTITGLGLKQAKDLVESAPNAVIKKDCPKEEAEKLMEALKKVGAEIVLE